MKIQYRSYNRIQALEYAFLGAENDLRKTVWIAGRIFAACFPFLFVANQVHQSRLQPRIVLDIHSQTGQLRRLTRYRYDTHLISVTYAPHNAFGPDRRTMFVLPDGHGIIKSHSFQYATGTGPARRELATTSIDRVTNYDLLFPGQLRAPHPRCCNFRDDTFREETVQHTPYFQLRCGYRKNIHLRYWLTGNMLRNPAPTRTLFANALRPPRGAPVFVCRLLTVSLSSIRTSPRGLARSYRLRPSRLPMVRGAPSRHPARRGHEPDLEAGIFRTAGRRLSGSTPGRFRNIPDWAWIPAVNKVKMG